MGTQAKVIAFVFGIAVAALLALPILLQEPKSTPQKVSDAPGLALPEEEQIPEAPVITPDLYESIRYGITYKEAVDLVGGMETRFHSEFDEGLAGYTLPSVTAWHTWENPDGSSMSLGFVKRKLTKKKQKNILPISEDGASEE